MPKICPVAASLNVTVPVGMTFVPGLTVGYLAAVGSLTVASSDAACPRLAPDGHTATVMVGATLKRVRDSSVSQEYGRRFAAGRTPLRFLRLLRPRRSIAVLTAEARFDMAFSPSFLIVGGRGPPFFHCQVSTATLPRTFPFTPIHARLSPWGRLPTGAAPRGRRSPPPPGRWPPWRARQDDSPPWSRRD